MINARVEPTLRGAGRALKLLDMCRERHLPIGSGAVEASAKHLVQHRIKRSGMRWSDPGARAILDLRCHLLS